MNAHQNSNDPRRHTEPAGRDEERQAQVDDAAQECPEPSFGSRPPTTEHSDQFGQPAGKEVGGQDDRQRDGAYAREPEQDNASSKGERGGQSVPPKSRRR